ncbi:hypothetical protein [Photobacterium lutimaris]|nr:hypothetical protein [Photobacterium lutimaris]
MFQSLPKALPSGGAFCLSGDWRLAIGDWRLAIGDWRLAIQVV